MASVDTHAPGSFCWIELATTDQNAAKQFYSSLFGWASNDNPMGPDAVYTIFSINDRNVGGCFNLSGDERHSNIPTHWGLYVATANADETAAKVAPAGGKVIEGPFDVMDLGRMAVIQDPTGAVICAWQANAHLGIGINDAAGTLCWADLMTPDQTRAAEFYKAVFGWTADPGQDGSGYLHFKNGETHIGGSPPPQHRDPNVPPHWMLYFLVENCDASTEKATGAGARVYMPPTTMAGVGRWSIVADPQGAVFALFQAERR